MTSGDTTPATPADDATPTGETPVSGEEQASYGRVVADERPAGDRRLPMLAWALSLLLVVSLAGLVTAVVALRKQDTTSDTRLSVMQAARQTAHDFTTYKYDTWDADAQRVLDGSTGQFKQEFSAAAGSVKASVLTGKATSAGEVLEAAVQSLDPDSAQVLVVADAVVTNEAQGGAKRRHYRMKLEMVREGDRWLVADLQAVG
ncbi:hypothetical protein [Kribbella deserti]|uniref:Mce-associated membrane protein n=1 Tax=Kribbella deserti TaxID=1926257 RepID=A0ABV6QVQ4_9ACTN